MYRQAIQLLKNDPYEDGEAMVETMTKLQVQMALAFVDINKPTDALVISD